MIKADPDAIGRPAPPLLPATTTQANHPATAATPTSFPAHPPRGGPTRTGRQSMPRDTRDPDKTINPDRPHDLARLDAIYMVAVAAVGSVVLLYVIEKIF
jgi:hypothetical protein